MVGLNESSTLWRLKTLRNNVPVRVVSRSGEFGVDSSKMTEAFIIEASRLLDFVEAMFPQPRIVNGSLVYYQKGYPNGFPQLQAQSISYAGHTPGRPIDPFESDPHPPSDTYEDYLEVTVEYESTPENDQPPDMQDPKTFLEVRAEIGGDFLGVNLGKEAVWQRLIGAPELVSVEDPTVQNHLNEALTEWQVSWKSVPYSWFTSTLKARLDSLKGKVNQAPMPLFHNAPAETILFTGYRYSQSYTWRTGFAGQPFIDIEMSFTEKNFDVVIHGDPLGPGDVSVNVNHNVTYNPPEGQYMRLLPDGSNRLYESVDMNAAFNA